MRLRSRFDFHAGLIALVSIYALYLAGRPFLPKHVGWFFKDLNSDRGVGLAALLSVTCLLLPAAHALRRRGFTRTLVAAYFFIYSALLSVELFFDGILGLASLACWTMRMGYSFFVIWGLVDLKKSYSASGIPLFPRLERDLKHGAWRICGGFLLFFFIHESLQEYMKHTAPFGDEIYFWFTASKHYLESSLTGMMKLHKYTPGVPWLITLPARLLGSKNDAWTYSYPVLIMMGYICLLREISHSWKSWLSGLSCLLAVFMTAQDLRWYYFGSLYGEAIAALLLAVALVEGLHWTARPNWQLNNCLGFGTLLGFISLSKPPIATLAPLIALTVLIFNLAQVAKRHWPPVIMLLMGYGFPFELWKLSLSRIGSHPEYSFSLSRLREAGVSLAPVHAILYPFANWSWHLDPPMALNLGILLSIAFLVPSWRRDLKLAALLSYCVYFGFILGLYATLWQQTETNSAGRYLSQVVIAGVLLIPMNLTQPSPYLGRKS